ncbi:bcl-2-like protein 13 [Oryzias latipes]|nr:bcl-2-like protein 13 [Oryzias latipes]
MESLGAWQSESLLAESWSTMGDVDPEDAKSLDSSDGAALTGEENHSSNSDIVHLERDEVEMLEEGEERQKRKGEEEDDEEELQASVLGEEEGSELQAPETVELLVSAEEPRTSREFRHVVPPMALPPLPIVKLDPPSTTSTPVPSTTASEAEEPFSIQSLHPPSILAPILPEPSETNPQEPTFSQIPFTDVEEHLLKEKPQQKVEPMTPKTKALSSFELLLGGAALVAAVGVLAYGALAYCKK